LDGKKGERRRDAEPATKQSGKVPRHRDIATDSFTAATSQLRRRFELEVELELKRGTASAEHAAPEFLATEPVDGVRTPRPKMPMSCIPRRTMNETQIRSLPLDHRAGFLLAHIDGKTNVRTILDVCGMSQDEVVQLIERLLALRAIMLT
jgi:hypothetical protein